MGQIILALGLVLNTKADLGVAAITSTAYCTSVIFERPIGDTNFIIYIIFITIEVLFHLKKKRFMECLLDVGQLGISFLITRFMNLFQDIIPVYYLEYPDTFLATIFGRFLVLLIAVIFIAIGAATTMNLHVLPNPGDGIVMVIADEVHKDTGLIKNFLDATMVATTLAFGLIARRQIIGIGFGTIFSMICVGRFIAVYNKIFGKFYKMLDSKTE